MCSVVCFLVVFVIEKFGETEATRKSVKVLTEFYKGDCARCWTEVQVFDRSCVCVGFRG